MSAAKTAATVSPALPSAVVVENGVAEVAAFGGKAELADAFAPDTVFARLVVVLHVELVLNAAAGCGADRPVVIHPRTVVQGNLVLLHHLVVSYGGGLRVRRKKPVCAKKSPQGRESGRQGL